MVWVLGRHVVCRKHEVRVGDPDEDDVPEDKGEHIVGDEVVLFWRELDRFGLIGSGGPA